MRFLLAPLLLLAVAASSSLAIAAVTVFRAPDLLNTAPDRVQVLMLSGPSLAFVPDEQRLRLAARHHASGASMEHSFDLERIDLSESELRGLKQETGESLWLYQIAEDDHGRYRLVQQQLNRWGRPGVRADYSLDLDVIVAGCLLPDVQGRTGSADKAGAFWVSLDDGGNFEALAHHQYNGERAGGGQLLLDPGKEVRSLDQQMLSGLKGLHPALQLC